MNYNTTSARMSCQFFCTHAEEIAQGKRLLSEGCARFSCDAEKKKEQKTKNLDNCDAKLARCTTREVDCHFESADTCGKLNDYMFHSCRLSAPLHSKRFLNPCFFCFLFLASTPIDREKFPHVPTKDR